MPGVRVDHTPLFDETTASPRVLATYDLVQRPDETWLASGLALGCESPEFDSPSELNNLRILGLSSSAQIVQPGQTVTLDALWVDARPDADDEVITAWFPGCANPEFGELTSCAEELNDLNRSSGEDWPAEFAPIAGSRVDMQVDPNLLEGREEWGLQYFFFAACRGSRFEFAPSRHPTVPITCRDSRSVLSGETAPLKRARRAAVHGCPATPCASRRPSAAPAPR